MCSKRQKPSSDESISILEKNDYLCLAKPIFIRQYRDFL